MPNNMKKLLILILLILFKITDTNATCIKASSFGWNATDATIAFQNALRSSYDTIIIDLQAGDWIVRPNSFTNLSNKTIIFEPGIVLLAKPNAFPGSTDCLLQLWSCTNIKIVGYGATFKMQKAEYTTGEWRHCLSMRACKNIQVFGLRLRDSGGDGLYIAGGNTLSYSEDILLKDIWSENNRRQGISVISAQHLLIQNCWFTDTKGTPPECGIDIEPNNNSDRITDVVFDKCRVTGNAGGGISVFVIQLDSSSNPIDITFSNCYSSGNHDVNNANFSAELSVTGSSLGGLTGNVKFERCMVENSQWSAVAVKKPAYGFLASFNDCVFVNISQNKNPAYNSPIFIEIPDYHNPCPRYGGVVFNNCLLTYSSNLSILENFSSSNSPGIGNVKLNNLTVINPGSISTIKTDGGSNYLDTSCVFNFHKFNSPPSTTVAFKASNSSLCECNDSMSVLTATRSSDSLNFPMAVFYDLAGTAGQDSDYLLMNGGMVIGANETVQTDTIFARKGDLTESIKSIALALHSSTLFTSGSGTQNLTIYSCVSPYDSIVTFEDRSRSNTELTGKYANINWGASGWAAYKETGLNPATKVLIMNTSATAQQINTFIILPGKVFKSLKIAAIGNPGTWEIIFSARGNPDCTWSDMTSALTVYVTHWAVASDTITVKITCSTGASKIILDDLTFRDIQAPTVPINLASDSITHTSFILSWTASSDNVGVNDYEVFDGGIIADTTSGTSIKIMGLSCSTTHSFMIRARDYAGNLSDTSKAISVTTIECDTIAPSIPFGLDSTQVTSSSFTLSWNSSTDNYGVSGYNVFKDEELYSSTADTALKIEFLKPSTSYSMTVKSKDASGNVSLASAPLIVTTRICGALPLGWTGVDIGTTGQASCESDGFFTIVGSGANIGGTADQFRYTYTNLSGNGTITTKVESIQPIDSMALSGVMIREDLTTGSKHVDCLMTSFRGVTFQNRTVSNGVTTSTSSSGLYAPYWVRLVRIGSTFIAYCSSDGASWIQLGSASNTMGTNVYIGLAVSSHSTGILCTSVFSNVTISSAKDTLPPSVPVGLTSSLVKPNSFTLKWNASTDDFGVAGYEVFKDGVSIGTTTKTYMNISGLQCDTNYSMTVRAYDESSNWSLSSAAFIVNTSSCPTTSIDSHGRNNKDLVIYPNPAKSTFTIANYLPYASMSVLTIDGKVVSKVISKDDEVAFDVSKWNKGLYFIQIQTESSVIVKKVIVE
jgi:chitodextrinase